MGKIIKDTIHADIARYKSDDPTAVIQNWMRNRDVIEFMGL